MLKEEFLLLFFLHSQLVSEKVQFFPRSLCRLSLIPFDPFGPIGPDFPAAPAGPCFPEIPAGPCFPGIPAGPCFPGGPGGPTRPFPEFCICCPEKETR